MDSLGSPGFRTANFSAASQAVRGVSPTYRPKVMCGARAHLPWPLDLVVGKGIHGIQQEGAYAGAKCSPGLFRRQRVEDGHQEAFCLAGACSGGHDDVASCSDLADGLLLVKVKRPVHRKGGTGEPAESWSPPPDAPAVRRLSISGIARGDHDLAARSQEILRRELGHQAE